MKFSYSGNVSAIIYTSTAIKAFPRGGDQAEILTVGG
jgi:hypothetical protein